MACRRSTRSKSNTMEIIDLTESMDTEDTPVNEDGISCKVKESCSQEKKPVKSSICGNNQKKKKPKKSSRCRSVNSKRSSAFTKRGGKFHGKGGKCHRPGPVTRNPYLNFLRQFRRTNCGITAVELIRRGAKAWNSLSPEKRTPFIKEAFYAPKRRRPNQCQPQCSNVKKGKGKKAQKAQKGCGTKKTSKKRRQNKANKCSDGEKKKGKKARHGTKKVSKLRRKTNKIFKSNTKSAVKVSKRKANSGKKIC